MDTQRTVSQLLNERGMTTAQLAAEAKLDQKVVESIVAQQYTTSPDQRARIAKALGVSAEQIQWGSAVEVHHMYGHGPQFGRSP